MIKTTITKIIIGVIFLLCIGGVVIYLNLAKLKEPVERRVGIKHNLVTDQYNLEDFGLDCFVAPTGVAVDKLDNVYVADYENSVITVFNSSGEKIRTIGKLGNGDGELFWPMGLTIHNDLLYVADGGNYRVQIFTLDGEVKSIISFKSQDVRPRDLVLFKDEIYLTVDSLQPYNIKVYKVSPEGRISAISDTLVGYIAEKGDENIVVVNQYNLAKTEKGVSGTGGIHNLYFSKGKKLTQSKIELPYKYLPYDFLYDTTSKMYYMLCGSYHTIDRYSEDGKYIDTIYKNNLKYGFLNFIAMDSKGVIYCTSTKLGKVFKISAIN